MPLLYEKQDHIGVLTLTRPEARNAWCNEFTAGLQERLPELEDDRDIRCVILTGDENGRAFSAGADLKNPRTIRRLGRQFSRGGFPSGGASARSVCWRISPNRS